MNLATSLFSIGLVLFFATAWSGCADDDSGSADDRCPSGYEFDADIEQCTVVVDSNGPGDAGTGDDVSSEDTGTDEDADSGSPDTGGQGDADGGEPDADNGEPDTDPDPDPPELPECGGDAWDDTHDGTNPWDPFEIDCDELAASWSCQATEEELKLIDAINEQRSQVRNCGGTEYGPSDPVTLNLKLQCASRIHSWDMDGRNYFDHDSLEEMKFYERIQMVGASYMGAGENLTYASTAEAAVQSWMNSPLHCRNLMCDSFTEAGGGTYGGKFTVKLTGYGLCN